MVCLLNVLKASFILHRDIGAEMVRLLKKFAQCAETIDDPSMTETNEKTIFLF